MTPPLLWRGFRHLVRRPEVPVQYGHTGCFNSFKEAFQLSTGYQDDAILKVTLENTKRIGGKAISILDARLLAALQLNVEKFSRPVRILDFGGALGSHYFSLRRFIGDRIASWTVVELPHTTWIGNAECSDAKLGFVTEPQDADIVIASGSLQYVEDPYRTLSDLVTISPHLILDKVPILLVDRWTLQRVDPSVFGVPVSFPAFFFGADKLRSMIDIEMEWPMPDYQALLDGQRRDVYQGFLSCNTRQR